MSRPSIPAQHLSDEAVAAYADGVLGSTARARADRHLGECAECRYAVAVQREATWALRAAPAPSLPTGLLDRLRAVPATTPLEGPFGGPPLAIGADGTAAFATFPTPPQADTAQMSEPTAPAARTGALLRRRGALTLLTAAAAVTVGAVSAVAAGTSSGAQQPFTPPAQQRVAPARYLPAEAPAFENQVPLYDPPALTGQLTAH